MSGQQPDGRVDPLLVATTETLALKDPACAVIVVFVVKVSSDQKKLSLRGRIVNDLVAVDDAATRRIYHACHQAIRAELPALSSDEEQKQ